MQSHELRGRFLTFFGRQGHTVRDSDSLIPSGDPTVLFTSAGMNQFKDYFLGKRTDLARAASCQKCLRTGDLERVGKTAYHHTFFEMLGNFSFGDYFKREAIRWAWEFLTGTLDFAGTKQSSNKELCLGLPAEKLWVSIYEEDDEAATLWQQLGVPKERIKRFGAEDNFWPSNAPKNGPNGPCGPCSEIYYDPEGKVKGPKSVEVWNLVFTQFNRLEGGKLEPLPRKNIDTGMGLERLTSVMMQHETGREVSDYETDLFGPIVESILGLFIVGRQQLLTKEVSTVWTIADHLRASVFLLADGVLPSNEKRGYVTRMLVRRAHWHGGRLLSDRSSKVGEVPEEETTFLADIADSVIDTYERPYRELREKATVIHQALRMEEERFIETLRAGNEQIRQELSRLSAKHAKQISGEFAFKMKDTYGYPLELLADITQRRGLQIDRSVFEQRLIEQKERSRSASQFGGDIFTPTTLKLGEDVKVEFVGYQALETDTVIKGIWKQGAWAQTVQAGDEVGVILQRSPFYGESGGQVGDQGAIECPHGRLDVLDTKWVDELLVHHAKVTQGTVKTNEPVRANVDPERRLRIARSHTATHLLHWALRKVLGPETVQAGSLVDVERVRFDFSSLGGLREEQKAKVEQLVSDRVLAGDPVHTDVMKLEDAKRAGALALFGEKYHAQVRVVSIGDYSKELCGGTHLVQTGAVGAFRIVAESSIAAGTRRVEAVVGESALARQQQDAQVLRAVAEQLGRSPQDVLQGIEEIAGQVKAAERQLKNLKIEFARLQAKQFIAEAKRINGISLVTARLDGADRELLSAMADAIKSSLTEGVALLVSAEPPSTVAWVMSLTANLVKRGLHAGELLKPIAAITNGGGGGGAGFAQAGGKDPSRIPEALKHAEQVVRAALEHA